MRSDRAERAAGCTFQYRRLAPAPAACGARSVRRAVAAALRAVTALGLGRREDRVQHAEQAGVEVRAHDSLTFVGEDVAAAVGEDGRHERLLVGVGPDAELALFE